MTIIGAILAYVLLDPPWTFVVIAALLVTDFFQILVWLRWRKRRSTTGPEGLIGEVARVETACRPEGMVHVAGQLWKAVCKEGAGEGDEVEITDVRGLTLQVVRR